MKNQLYNSIQEIDKLPMLQLEAPLAKVRSDDPRLKDESQWKIFH